MRLFILSILIFTIHTVNCQFAYLVSVNELILGPDEVVELTGPVIDFYYQNYSDKYQELEATLSGSFGTDQADELRQDVEALDDMLALWIDAKNKDFTNEFLDQYESGKCYEIISSKGDAVTEYDVVMTKDQNSALLHKIRLNVKVLPEKGQWVRKRKPNCESTTNPDDCYVACYLSTGGEYVVENDRDELMMAFKPSNFEFDESERILSFSTKIVEERYIMDLETGQKFMISEWKMKECNY